jgi:ApeA N-terminal domain 1
MNYWELLFPGFEPVEERMDDFLCKPHYGRWWYSGHPEVSFSGALQMSDDDTPELVIHGKQSALPLIDRPPEPTTIFGRLTTEATMRDISILGAQPKRGPTSTSPPDPERETEVAFRASDILIGAHIESEERPCADRMIFNLTGLEEWCTTTGFSGKYDHGLWTPDTPKDALAAQSANLSFKSSATPYFDIGGGRQMRFHSRYRGPSHFGYDKQITLAEKNKIEIVFPERVSIDAAVDEMRLWQSFIALALRLPVFLDEIELATDDGGDRFHGMSLIVPERKWMLPKEKPYRSDILFNQSKLGAKIGERLKAWREKQDKIDVSVLLFRSTCYLRDVYVHTHVPTYLQALEVFHRELYNDDKFPNADAKKRALTPLRAAIPPNLDPALQKEISQRLSFIASATYLERLQLLFQRYPKCLQPLFPGGNKDLKSLRNARNFLTHYDEDQGDLDKEFMSSRDVHVVGEKARLFLEVCFLGAMDMTDDEIFELLKDFGPYRDWCAETRLENAHTRRA